ncbi:MAG TPA: class I SAM-dependent methyltransferase [Candidatus Binatia bacterium]|nr:class I SAM-dependent methyltransferase [Candidatus Binatia bacterium]
MSRVPPATGDYVARRGYQAIDARRYERRRYGTRVRRLNLRRLEGVLARALADVPRDRPVLDVPCGTGILLDSLAAQGFRVVASDISPAMLSVTRPRAAALGLGCVRADLESPPYRPRSFGAVVCVRFLMHLDSAQRVRVLRGLAELTSGPVVGTVCHPYTWKSFARAVRRWLGGRAKRSPRLTRRALEAEVSAAGLQLESVTPVLPVFSEVWVVVIRTPRSSSVETTANGHERHDHRARPGA